MNCFCPNPAVDLYLFLILQALISSIILLRIFKTCQDFEFSFLVVNENSRFVDVFVVTDWVGTQLFARSIGESQLHQWEICNIFSFYNSYFKGIYSIWEILFPYFSSEFDSMILLLSGPALWNVLHRADSTPHLHLFVSIMEGVRKS